jgi:transglutaminase-like putative cysteine protease
LKDEDLVFHSAGDNGWLNDVMEDATREVKENFEKARNIYAYLRDNMTCTNYNRTYLEKPLKTVLKTRNGSEAEINLLLTAMLLKAGLHC